VTASELPPSISPSIDFHSLIEEAVLSIKAASLEKYGCSPSVSLKGLPNSPVPCLSIPALLHTSLLELLKNALKATVEKCGVLGLEDAAPIVIDVKVEGEQVRLSVADEGVGLSSARADGFSWFSSEWGTRSGDHRVVEGEDWRYSRSFGAPLFGAGVGLARTSINCKLHGGSLSLSPGAAAVGACATLLLNAQGRVPFEALPLTHS